MKLREETAEVKFEIRYYVSCGDYHAEIKLLIPAKYGILIEPFQNPEVTLFMDRLGRTWGSKVSEDYREAVDIVHAESRPELDKKLSSVMAESTQIIQSVVSEYNSKIEKLPESYEFSKAFSYKVADTDV